MLEKDPLTYSLLTYVSVLGLSIFGGIASYIGKIKRQRVNAFSIMELIGEVVVAAFVGIITFFGCEAADIPQVLAAAIIGVTSHMGSRALFKFELWIDKKFMPFNDITDRVE